MARSFGYTQASRRSAASTQVAALTRAGVSEIYAGDAAGAVFKKLLHKVEDGDRIAVDRLADLAANRKELRFRVDAVHQKGGFVVEVASGRDSRKRLEFGAMIFDAVEVLTHVAKGHSSKKAKIHGARGGRPRPDRGISDAEAEKHWFSKAHRSNADAIAHMGKWNVSAATRHFGPSGRQPGPRAS